MAGSADNEYNSSSTPTQFTKPKLFSFKGRIDAWRFLAYFIIYTLIYVVVLAASAWILIPLFSTRPDLNITSLPILYLLLIYSLSFLPQHIPARRRLYDLGKNGKWSILLVLPAINIPFVMYLLFAKGDQASNQYGKPSCPSGLALKIFSVVTPIFIIIVIMNIIELWKAAI